MITISQRWTNFNTITQPRDRHCQVWSCSGQLKMEAKNPFPPLNGLFFKIPFCVFFKLPSIQHLLSKKNDHELCWKLPPPQMDIVHTNVFCFVLNPSLGLLVVSHLPFFQYENIRMAYGHPRSRSCGGLEGPFRPCSFPEFKIDPAI